MTPAEEIAAYLEAGEALEREATKGPWSKRAWLVIVKDATPDYSRNDGDAAFIAAAREREPRERRALAELANLDELLGRAISEGQEQDNAMEQAIHDRERIEIEMEAFTERIAAILRGE